VAESTTPVVRNSRTLDKRHGPAQGRGGAEPGRRKGPVMEMGESCSGHDDWNRKQELDTLDR
jgi:hypothetical protein